MEEAQAHAGAVAGLVDRFAARYTPAVIALAALVTVVPPLAFGGAAGRWCYRALVLLVIACPCALVISHAGLDRVRARGGRPRAAS